MRHPARLRQSALVFATAATLFAPACGEIGDARRTAPGQPMGPPGTTPSPDNPDNPGTPTTPGTPDQGKPPEAAIPTEPSYLPARVRRLSNYEYDRSVSVLLQTTSTAARSFAPDFRQNDFTQNAAQQVDSVIAGQLQSAARDLAKPAVSRLVSSAGCGSPLNESCADRIIRSFGQRAYRRPLTEDEVKGLTTVFRAGAKDRTFEDGLELMLNAVLESPNFLFVTELGDAPAKDGLITLGEYEIASALSYAFTGGPPDQGLMDAAAGKRLSNATERVNQAKRLLMTNEARPQVARLVKEWLGLDYLDNTGKDANVFPKYNELKPLMTKEADSFITEVVFNDDGTVPKLLTADYTVAEPALTQFYGIGSPGGDKRAPFGTTPRRGVLMQGAFMAVHANDHETHPVKRGNTILKKVLCVVLPQPGELNLMVVPPPPDKNKTTRDRFSQHSTDKACSGCHAQIDPLGFAFENIDGMGGLRRDENGKPVVTETTVAAGDIAGPVKDGAELVQKMAGSADVQQCFARNLFRFSMAQGGQGYEQLFLDSVWKKMDEAKRVNVKDMLSALAGSDLFVTRKVQQ